MFIQGTRGTAPGASPALPIHPQRSGQLKASRLLRGSRMRTIGSLVPILNRLPAMSLGTLSLT